LPLVHSLALADRLAPDRVSRYHRGMQERILAFVHTLRTSGVRISVAETLDAVRGVTVAGVEREVLRETLAATVVKDEGDRPVLDRLFDASCPLRGAEEGSGRKRRRAGGGGAGTPWRGQTGSGTGQGGREPARASAATGAPREEPRAPGPQTGRNSDEHALAEWDAGAATGRAARARR